MKTKRLSLLLIVILLFSCLVLPASAAGTSAKLSYVTDQAGILTQAEQSELESRAADMSARYNMGIYIIVIDDYRNYSSYSDIYDAAVDLFQRYNLGWDSDKAGITLLLSMDDRDFVLDVNSDRARYAFTEDAQDELEEKLLGWLRDNQYYNGFQGFLDGCERMLQLAAEGNPFQYSESSSFSLFALIPGALAALFANVGLSAPMHSTGKQHNANAYVVQGSLHLTRRSDLFLHRTVTRTPRQTQQNRSGGGSVRHSSGTHSGRSGKF